MERIVGNEVGVELGWVLRFEVKDYERTRAHLSAGVGTGISPLDSLGELVMKLEPRGLKLLCA